jgi:hypothetical protein
MLNYFSEKINDVFYYKKPEFRDYQEGAYDQYSKDIDFVDISNSDTTYNFLRAGIIGGFVLYETSALSSMRGLVMSASVSSIAIGCAASSFVLLVAGGAVAYYAYSRNVANANENNPLSIV